ncbi:MAG: hypothetical protein ACLFSA_00335 [Spirochaetaceae bacterium]
MKKAVKSALENRNRRLLLCLLLLVVVTGCASVPEPGEGGYSGLLYRRGSVLFILNMEEDREFSEYIVSKVMEEHTAESFLDRTDRIYVRLFEGGTNLSGETSLSGGTRFELIAEGRYPRRLGGFALKREGWEKMNEPSVWWNSSEDNLQIAFPSSRIAAVSQDNMEGLLSRIHEPKNAAALPQKVNTLSENSSLYIYGEKPQLSSYFNSRIENLLSRVEEFRMGFYPTSAAGTKDTDGSGTNRSGTEGSGTYRVDGEYRFSEESTARSFLLSLRLALLSRAGAEGKNSVMEIVEKRYVTQKGRSVHISGMHIRGEDIDLLFGIFTPQF